MKNKIYKSVLIMASIGLFIGCKPHLTAPAASPGNINPARYVAIGNSITSGFADGALYYDGQMVSYPNLIAQQLKLVGGNSTFNQPLMPAGSIGCGTTDSSGHTIFVAPFKLGYATDCLNATSLLPIPSATSGDKNALFTSIASQGPFNNMGVPGARAVDVAVSGYGNTTNGNPFFARMASSSSASMLSDAMLIKPTFFSLFIGNNDVLLYATNGGAAPAAITSQSAFDASINAIVDTLTKQGAKGVIGNIPDITMLPFFTTIPWNGLALTQALADQLNALWCDPSTSPPTPLYNFKAGNNGFLIKDNSPAGGPLKQRLMVEGEFVLLSVPLNSVKCNYLGSEHPIPDQYILTAPEIANVQTAVTSFNASIKTAADKNKLALVDVNAFFNQTKTGFAYNGINFNTAFVTGGTFSLDGIHLTPVGNALLANEFIKAINTTYSSTIPQLDPTKYHGIIFP